MSCPINKAQQTCSDQGSVPIPIQDVSIDDYVKQRLTGTQFKYRRGSNKRSEEEKSEESDARSDYRKAVEDALVAGSVSYAAAVQLVGQDSANQGMVRRLAEDDKRSPISIWQSDAWLTFDQFSEQKLAYPGSEELSGYSMHKRYQAIHEEYLLQVKTSIETEQMDYATVFRLMGKEYADSLVYGHLIANLSIFRPNVPGIFGNDVPAIFGKDVPI